jgi:hypothetical protein
LTYRCLSDVVYTLRVANVQTDDHNVYKKLLNGWPTLFGRVPELYRHRYIVDMHVSVMLAEKARFVDSSEGLMKRRPA